MQIRLDFLFLFLFLFSFHSFDVLLYVVCITPASPVTLPSFTMVPLIFSFDAHATSLQGKFHMAFLFSILII